MASTVNDAAPESAWLARETLDPGTLDAVRQANLAFLDLLKRRRARMPHAPELLGLRETALDRAVQLEGRALETLANCPYSLFNLRFEDPGYWGAVVADAARPTIGIVDDDANFARIAVFLAWHLAQRGEFAAALVLGMTAEVRAAWRELPLSALDRAAMAGLPHLEARWGRHGRFWPELLAASERPADGLAEQVRLLGLQLMAADGYRTRLGRRLRTSHHQPIRKVP